MKLALSACGLALAVDSAMFSQAGIPSSAAQLAGFAVVHGTVSLLFSAATVTLLPTRFQEPPVASGLFFFMVVVFVPVFGMIGLLSCIVPALRQQTAANQPRECEQSSPWSSTPLVISTGGGLRSSQLAGILHHTANPKKRMEALVATLCLEDRQAVALLRMTLKDPDDEVRLLAFALLNRRELAIETRMREWQEQAGNDEPDHNFIRHKALAHAFWELAHLSTPAGSTLASLCGRAHEHAMAALRLRPRDAGLQFILGQVLLTLRQLGPATEAFENACRLGIDARHCAPFLAEIAFRQQRYSEIAAQFAVGRSFHQRPGNAAAFWERTSHGAVER